MCKCTIDSKQVHLELDLNPSADFISCLMTAVITALPSFLEAFMKCLAGDGSPGTDGAHKPGTRTRCT